MLTSLVCSLTVLAAASLVAAIPPVTRDIKVSRSIYNSTTACQQQNVRKAWNTLSDEEKKAYIDAELCLMSLPAVYGFEGAQNRFDELMYTHIYLTNVIHYVGSFLPWHRYFMYVHEYILKNECGYTGTQPYWHESMDVANVTTASVFDPVTGFGGNGVGTNSCIADGPFANMTLHLGPLYEITDHCLSRSQSESGIARASVANIETCMELENYTTCYDCLSENPHTSGHAAVGGVMLDIQASPGDPIFYLHHTNLDRIWWNWQKLDLPKRFTDMGGVNVPDQIYITEGNLRNVTSAWTDYDGDGGLNITTLNHVLDMRGILPNITVGDVMDITNATGLLCYTYDDDIKDEVW